MSLVQQEKGSLFRIPLQLYSKKKIKKKEEEDSFKLFMQAVASLFAGDRMPSTPQDYVEEDEVIAEFVH